VLHREAAAGGCEAVDLADLPAAGPGPRYLVGQVGLSQDVRRPKPDQ
jgi:hypothetical protein